MARTKRSSALRARTAVSQLSAAILVLPDQEEEAFSGKEDSSVSELEVANEHSDESSTSSSEESQVSESSSEVLSGPEKLEEAFETPSPPRSKGRPKKGEVFVKRQYVPLAQFKTYGFGPFSLASKISLRAYCFIHCRLEKGYC